MTKKGEKLDWSRPFESVEVTRSNENGDLLPNGMPAKHPEKSKRPDSMKKQMPDMKPGENARYLRHSLAMWNLPVLDISDENAVRERILWYFEHCADNDMKPTVTGLALAVGTTTNTLQNWATGRSRKGTHTELIVQAKMLIEDQMNAYMENGKINPVAGIFLLKNHFGYKDQQETIITPNTSMGEMTDANEMRVKYLDNVGGTEDEDD